MNFFNYQIKSFLVVTLTYMVFIMFLTIQFNSIQFFFISIPPQVISKNKNNKFFVKKQKKKERSNKMTRRYNMQSSSQGRDVWTNVCMVAAPLRKFEKQENKEKFRPSHVKTLLCWLVEISFSWSFVSVVARKVWTEIQLYFGSNDN